MEATTTQADESRKTAEPVRTMTLCKCEVKAGRARKVGKPEVFTLSEAMNRLAPSRAHRARMNVVNVRAGWYIGLRDQGEGKLPTNFLFKNPTGGGDVRWIIQEMPEFEDVVLELYYVKDVEIPNGMEGEPGFQRGRPRAR